MRGIRTLDPSCGPQPSNPFRKSSPAAAALWNKSNPVARAQNLESETKYLSSYFADTALEFRGSRDVWMTSAILGGWMFGYCSRDLCRDSEKEGRNLQKTSVTDGFFWRCKARSGTVIEPISNPPPLPY